MPINWNIGKNYLSILCVFKFKGFHNKAEGGGGGVRDPRAKICHEPRATLIQPWPLVGSSCGFNANCQRSKESTDDFPRRRITGAAQASSVKYGGPGPIIPLGPRWTTIIPPAPSTNFLSPCKFVFAGPPWAGVAEKIAPFAPSPCMGGPGATPVLS